MPDLLLFEIKKSLRGSKELAVCKAAAAAVPPTIEPRPDRSIKFTPTARAQHCQRFAWTVRARMKPKPDAADEDIAHANRARGQALGR